MLAAVSIAAAGLALVASACAAAPSIAYIEGLRNREPRCESSNPEGWACDFNGEREFFMATWTCVGGCLVALDDDAGTTPEPAIQGGGTSEPPGARPDAGSGLVMLPSPSPPSPPPRPSSGPPVPPGGPPNTPPNAPDAGSMSVLDAGPTLPEGLLPQSARCMTYNRDGFGCNFTGVRTYWGTDWTCADACLELEPTDAGSGLPDGVLAPDPACTQYNRDGYTCQFNGTRYFWNAYWDCYLGCLRWLSM